MDVKQNYSRSQTEKNGEIRKKARSQGKLRQVAVAKHIRALRVSQGPRGKRGWTEVKNRFCSNVRGLKKGYKFTKRKETCLQCHAEGVAGLGKTGGG